MGHVLRSGESTPAYLPFRFACLNSRDEYKGRRGAHRTNLLDIVLKDVFKRKLISSYKVVKSDEFNKLVHMAHDRVAWSKLKSA